MIELGKKYKTRDGREVRIYAVDGNVDRPVHGAVLNTEGWQPMVWCRDGRWSSCAGELSPDLVEVKPRIQREVWVNVYPSQVTDVIHRNKATADAVAQQNRIACVKLVIDCEEGHGL
jgi:hypothetical protein